MSNWHMQWGRIGGFKGIGRRIGRCNSAKLGGELGGETIQNWEHGSISGGQLRGCKEAILSVN